MVPAVPLLFLAAVPVLNALPRVARWTIVGMSFAISFAVSMTREDVPTALGFLASEGPTLPILLTLERVASGYADLQLPGASFWLAAGSVGLVLAVIWRPVWRTAGRQPA
jgi:hypothetical protein